MTEGRRASHWIGRLRRATTSGDWIPEIDGLRFFAIASVLLFHIQGQVTRHYSSAILPPFTWIARAFGHGNRGVPLFFVISGFILARPFAQQHLFRRPAPSLHKYLRRRVTRLEPPYLLNLIAVAIALALVDHQPWRVILPHLVASACYLHYFIYHTGSTINSVAWSLEIEVQFYLLAPLLALAFALRNASLRRALLVASMVAASLIQMSVGVSTFTLAGRIQYFLAGLLLADLYLVSMARWRHHWQWDLISFAGWPAFFLLGDRLESVWLPFLALLLCIATLRGVAMYAVTRNPWIAVTGGACYTIYLWHAPVLTFVDRLLAQIPFFAPANYGLLLALQVPVKIVAVALVCLPLFVFVERPCMDPNWLQKFAARLRATFNPAAAAPLNQDPGLDL